jgi:hypothetical protein
MEEQGMINKVAEAIRDNIAASLPDGVSVEYRYAAIAAIDAMREPTSAMMNAGDGCCGEYGCGDYRMKQIFSAMIDAALNDQERT